MSAQIEGLDKLLARLGGMPEAVKTEVSGALAKNGDRMVALSKSLAPRGETGKLVESIRAEIDPNGLGVSVKAGGPSTTKEVRGGSGVPFDYAAGVEWGTDDTAKEPYFYPSFRALKRVMRSNLSRALKRGVAKSGGAG